MASTRSATASVSAYVHSLAKATTVSYKPKAPPAVHVKQLVTHPGKGMRLRNVRAIHLGHPTVKKVSL